MQSAVFSFTVVFYGRINFRCKSTHFCATRRESETTVTPGVSNAAQRCENARKKSALNYKSAALSGRATGENMCRAEPTLYFSAGEDIAIFVIFA
jgi:hypothetical protein